MKISLNLTPKEISLLKKLADVTDNKRFIVKIKAAILDSEIKLPLKNEPVDLRKCKVGDILVSKHGKKFVYHSPNKDGTIYPHHIAYIEQPEQIIGSRTDDGHVFQFSCQPNDHDIVLVIKNNP